MLLALDYLHTECKLVHTGIPSSRAKEKNKYTDYLEDIKPDNIMQELNDTSVLGRFVRDEVEKPSPRKIIGDSIVYLLRLFDPPKIFGRAFLCDFGETISGEEERNHNAQPEFYRSPEVMLMANWSYPADIWNLGAMVSRERNPVLGAFLLIHLKTDLNAF